MNIQNVNSGNVYQNTQKSAPAHPSPAPPATLNVNKGPTIKPQGDEAAIAAENANAMSSTLGRNLNRLA